MRLLWCRGGRGRKEESMGGVAWARAQGVARMCTTAACRSAEPAESQCRVCCRRRRQRSLRNSRFLQSRRPPSAPSGAEVLHLPVAPHRHHKLGNPARGARAGRW
jgi:hypothetical protein